MESLSPRGRRTRYDNYGEEAEAPRTGTQESAAASALSISAADEELESAENAGFEYVDHTADVGIRAWGPSLAKAFEAAGLALFGYMTDLSLVNPTSTRDVVVPKEDTSCLERLFFHYMDELLFLYGSDYFIARRVHVTEEDESLTVHCEGETFDLKRHTQGTEVKAITMHELMVTMGPPRCTVQVLLDI